MSHKLGRCFQGILEVLEAFGLLICLLLSPVFGLFKSFDKAHKFWYQTKVFLPRGLFIPALRAHLEAKLGNHQQAANILDQVAYVLESEQGDDKISGVSRVLRDVYCGIFKLNILVGNLELATLTVIRAHQKIGLDRLPSTPGFDVKVAQVVKAGIAAGKLLEEGGLATLMVRHGDEPSLSKPENLKGKGKFKRQKNKDGATIIQCPTFDS